MSGLSNLSIRALLGLIIGVMGLLLIVLSASALVEALGRSQDARKVATLAPATQALFKALQSHRLERGNELAPLMAEAPAPDVLDRVVAAQRKTAEDGYAAGLAILERLDLPGLPATLTALKSAHDAVATLRPKADAALLQPKSARDASVLQSWPKLTQAYLDALDRKSVV